MGETIEDLFVSTKRHLKDAWWWTMYRIHPKHRYHIVKTHLKPNYYDPNILIFESAFALLCDFVEFNTKNNNINWAHSEEYISAWNEMNELVDWYKNIRPCREDKFLEEHPEPKSDFTDYIDDRNSLGGRAWSKHADKHIEAQKVWFQEDEDNLIRLIRLRSFMWYT